MELWNEKALEKSERVLNQLKEIGDFVVIGGWAVYLLTKTVKSLDVDIYTNFKNFFDVQSKLAERGIFVTFNQRLKKYSTKIEEIDIDIYTPDQCSLTIPCKDIFDNKWFEVVEGFKIIKAEPLLLLKLSSELSRKNKLKGFKDRVDILALITKLDIDMKFLGSLFDRYNTVNLKSRLLAIIKESSEEYNYAFQQKILPSKLKKIKRGLLEKFKYL
jgi:hypothetical protein